MAEPSLNGAVARPRRRNAASTRRKLLIAARQEFARNGLAGARVDAIAAQAGVNKQLLYHYFGDKDAIYVAVLEWIYDEIKQYEQSLNFNGLKPDRLMKKIVESWFDYLSLHPDFVAIMDDESRNQAVHIRGLQQLPAIGPLLLRIFSLTLAQGAREGVFRRGVNPTQLCISIGALSYFYFSGLPTLQAIFNKNLSTEPALRERRRHVVDFVMRALRP